MYGRTEAELARAAGSKGVVDLLKIAKHRGARTSTAFVSTSCRRCGCHDLQAKMLAGAARRAKSESGADRISLHLPDYPGWAVDEKYGFSAPAAT